MAPSAKLNEEEIDDLIYLARVNELDEFKTELEKLTTRENCDVASIILAAKDSESGNGVLHMAAANGHVGMSHSPFPWSSPQRSRICPIPAEHIANVLTAQRSSSLS